MRSSATANATFRSCGSPSVWASTAARICSQNCNPFFNMTRLQIWFVRCRGSAPRVGREADPAARASPRGSPVQPLAAPRLLGSAAHKGDAVDEGGARVAHEIRTEGVEDAQRNHVGLPEADLLLAHCDGRLAGLGLTG